MNHDPAENHDRLSELLLAWEESVRLGHPLSVTTLCSGAPELAAALEHEMALLQTLDQFMQVPQQVSPPSPPFFHRETGARSEAAGPRTSFPTLPGYEILAEIGRGGMGVVYQARQQSLQGRLVAIKTLAGTRWTQPAFVSRLRKEANALSQLNHPHVLQVFDVIETPSSVSLVLEYIDGENLAQRMKGARNTPTANAVAQIAYRLARTLMSVHAQGLLHRDIKPANILINRQGDLKIADFGLAKELGISDGQTVTGELYGSPSYMAPELANGRKEEVDTRTDIYAVGATLYEMLTGRPPFVGTSTVDTLNQVLNRDPVSPRALNPQTPRDLETICLKCLEKEPIRRFHSAQELAEELDRFLRGIPIHSRPIPWLNRAVRWCQRRPAAAGLIGLSTAAPLAIVSLILWRSASLKQANHDLVRVAKQARDLQQLAEENARLAKSSENQAKDGLYASDMGRASTAWKQEDTRDLTELLRRYDPRPNELDRRGFEWWYLQRQSNLTPRVLLEAGAPQYMMAYSPDRTRLATVGKDAVVRLFDPESGKVFQEIPTGQIEVNGLDFSPDGTELATAGDNGTICLWNLATGSARLKLITDFAKAYDVLYIPHQKQLVTCGNSAKLMVFSTETGQVVHGWEGHEPGRAIESLAVSQDGQTLISAGNDNSIRIWNLIDATLTASIAATDNVAPMVYVPDRQLLITGNSAGILRTIDVGQFQAINQVKHLDRLGSVALHPEGTLVAVGDVAGRIRLRQISSTGEILADQFQPWQGHRDNVYFLVWSPDGTRLISSGKDGLILSWNLKAAQRTDRVRLRLDEVTGNRPFSRLPTRPLRVPPGDAIARWNSQIQLPARRPGQQYQQLCFSREGRFLATMNAAAVLELFAVPADQQTPLDADRLTKWNSSVIGNLIGFVDHSRSLAVQVSLPTPKDGRADSRILILKVPNLDDGIELPFSYTKYAAASPDGNLIAFGTPEYLNLWDIDQHKLLWKTPLNNIRHVVFSPDGQWIATATSNRKVMIWNVVEGTPRVQFTSHRSLIHDFVFSPDSQTLVTATLDQTIKFSHVATGQELLELPHTGRVHRLEFSADGHRLICQTRMAETPEEIDEIQIFDGTPLLPEEPGGQH